MAGSITYILFGNANPLIKAFAAAYGAISGINSAIGALASGLTGVTGGISGVGDLFKAAISGAADMESAQVAFETLTQSVGKATTLMADLQKFANETPLEFPEIAQAGKQMLAYGFAAKDVTNELRMLGDVAALLDKPLGEMAYLYGTSKTQGRLFGKDVLQFTGAGVPLMQELAKQFGVGVEQVNKLVESGQVGFPQLRQAFVSMTSAGGQFFEGLKKQSTTTKGLWSTFTDGINGLLREFGKPILPELKKILTQGIALTDQLVGKAREWGQAVATAMGVVRELFASGDLWAAFSAGLRLAIAEGISGLATVIDVIGDTLSKAIALGVENGFSGMLGFAQKASHAYADAFLKALDVQGARAQFNAVVGPALDKVRADQAAAAKALADAIAAPDAPDAPAPVKKMQVQISTVSSGDRLAKIGGAIGNGGPAGERFARDTAKNTADSARYLARIVDQTKPRTTSATF